MLRRSQTSCTSRSLRLLHALDHLLARGAAAEVIAFRQKASFARHVLDVAGENVAVQQARDDLLGRQPFGNVIWCWTTLPSTIVSTTSRTLARLAK